MGEHTYGQHAAISDSAVDGQDGQGESLGATSCCMCGDPGGLSSKARGKHQVAAGITPCNAGTSYSFPPG